MNRKSQGDSLTDSLGGFSPQSRRFLCKKVEEVLGIKMPESKVDLLVSRLNRRIRKLNLEDLNVYAEFLNDPETADKEKEFFIDAITTNTTQFYREPRHFEFLRKMALPAICKNRSDPYTIKIWSAGCSTGMEPYSIAFICENHLRSSQLVKYWILATDISKEALVEATKAVYEERDIEPLPLEFRERFFMRHKNPSLNLVKVTPEIRSKLQFGYLNFIQGKYPIKQKFDIVFCRNVLMYCNSREKQKILDKFCKLLKPGGLFFLGHAESISSLKTPFKRISDSVYQIPS